MLAPCVLAAPATAQPRCGQDSGVRVVVDQGPLGGGTRSYCAPEGGDRPVSQLLADVGVDVTWVQRYPGTFVCRLDGRPRDLRCADTPPPDRYWGLFWARRGQTGWTYSSEGAGSLRVAAGGAVGWRFQDGGDLEPPDLTPGVQQAGDTPGSASEPADDDEQSTTDGGAGDDGSSLTLVALLVAAVLGAAGLLVRRRRARS